MLAELSICSLCSFRRPFTLLFSYTCSLPSPQLWKWWQTHPVRGCVSVLEPDSVRQQLIVNCERAQSIPFCLFVFIIAKNLISDLLHWHVHRSLWMFGEDFKTSVFGFAVCMAGCECAQASLCFSCKVLLPRVEKKYAPSSCPASGCLISLQVCFVVHFSSCVFLRPLSGFPLCCWPNLNEILDLTAP